MIGLGTGTLAAWSVAGDVVRFYELDPEVARLSEGEEPVFTHLRDAPGEVSVALGDGRLSLQREPPQGYDVLVVDAFSSDAIPTHLLTVEAFAVYLRHLAEGGVIAVHVTNRYVDLKPVVRGAARALSLHAEHVPSSEKGMLWSSDWMLVARGRRSPRGRGRQRGDAAPPGAERARSSGRTTGATSSAWSSAEGDHFTFFLTRSPRFLAESGAVRTQPGSPVCLRPRRGGN